MTRDFWMFSFHGMIERKKQDKQTCFDILSFQNKIFKYFIDIMMVDISFRHAEIMKKLQTTGTRSIDL